MKASIAAVCALAIAMSAIPALGAPASAQEGDWRDPDWGLSYSAQGWRLRTGPPTNQRYEETWVFIASRAGDRLGPLCTLKYLTARDVSPLTRAQLNARTRTSVEGAALDELREVVNVGAIDVHEVDGIAVAQFEFSDPSMRGVEQRFVLLRDGELRAYRLYCSAADGDELSLAAISALAATLRFSR